ncbi:MAG: hypothetical protein ACMUJM_24655, partial [bacterium]
KCKYWENALLNFSEIYKYKRRLNKCVGVIAFKKGNYFDLNWAFFNSEWIYNKNLEKVVQEESVFYGENVDLKQEIRYKFQE